LAASSGGEADLPHPAEAGGFLGGGGLLECAVLLAAMNLCFAAAALGAARSRSSDGNYSGHRGGLSGSSDGGESIEGDGSGSFYSSSGSGRGSLAVAAWAAWVPAVVANFAACAALLRLQGRHAKGAAAARALHREKARAAKANQQQQQQQHAAAAALAGEGAAGATIGSSGSGLLVPGQSIKRLEAGQPLGPADMPSFTPGDLHSFELRTVGYKKHGRKAASSAPLYDLVALDVFKTASRVTAWPAVLLVRGVAFTFHCFLKTHTHI
jgi:hypothetical protein